MQAVEQFLLCDGDTFDDLVPNERDQYLVEGRGERFHLRSVIRVPGDDEGDFRQVPHDFWPVGLIGLTTNGDVAACFVSWARETSPMAPAAAFLAASELARSRRGENESVIAWLEALFSLPDSRP